MKLRDIAVALGCEIHAGADDLEISGVAGMEQAAQDQLTFLANPKYRSRILGAVLSGAGPSVLVFLGEKGKDGKGREKKEKDQKVKDGKVSAERAVAQVSAYLRAHGLKAELISTAITRQGASQGIAWVKRRS